MRKLWLFCVAILLSGCASMSSQQQTYTFQENGRPLGTHYLTWTARQQQLSAIPNWNIQGGIAIHNDQHGWNASFNWQQQAKNYTLVMFGPLGANRIQLSGTATSVTLQTPNQTLTAATPEELVSREIGYPLPVSSLYYWIRGLPSPYSPILHRSMDMNNHLANLTQQGWSIIYLRYLSVNGKDLPDRMLLNNGNLQIRIVITGWQV